MFDYIDFVEPKAREGQDELFFSSGPFQAGVVISRIFKYSKDIVRIYCGDLIQTFFIDEEYLMYLRRFLVRGGKLIILSKQDFTECPEKIFKVLMKFPYQVEMRRTSSNVIYNPTEQPLYFIIGDNKMTRIELGKTARFNFGNEADAKMFIEIFDEILEKTKLKPVLI